MEFTKEEIMYTEIYEILQLLGNTYINKLPKDLYKVICNFKNNQYNVKFDLTKDISQQVISDTIDFFAYLNMMYWVDKNEKARLYEIYKNNDIKKSELKSSESYNHYKIFNKDIINRSTENIENNQIMPLNKEKWYKTFFSIVKKIFHKRK